MTSDDPDTSGTTPKRRKRSDGLRTIERVLKAAEDEMAEVGFVKFNLDRVMEKSGVARSSVYHHFGGRDGVIAALETTSTMRSLERGTAEFEAFLDTLNSLNLVSDHLDLQRTEVCANEESLLWRHPITQLQLEKCLQMNSRVAPR